MKIGDLVYAADKTSFQTLYEGIGLLVRPDEGEHMWIIQTTAAQPVGKFIFQTSQRLL